MTRRQFTARSSALVSAAATIFAQETQPAEGQELIGTPAPALALKNWLNSKPLELSDLRGKVVLLRWWTEGCPYCTATAPALLDLEQKFGAQGLQVIGIYHPKPPGQWKEDAVRRAAAAKHLTFPVAIDGDWVALKRWWLTKDRGYTSVSFLVDQRGIIRYIHPGGEFHEGQQGGLPEHEACNRDMHFIRSEIATLLKT